MPLSDEQRQKIVDEVKSWVGTPYVGHSAVKGPKGGVDCGQLIKAVYLATGHRPADGVPLPTDYSLEIWRHKADTTYIETVEKYMREIPESEVKPGDMVLYKMGHGFAHSAIVVKWPEYVIHALSQRAGGVVAGHGGQGQFSTNIKFSRLEKKFYTVREEYC